jgi:hypothetical protein
MKLCSKLLILFIIWYLPLLPQSIEMAPPKVNHPYEVLNRELNHLAKQLTALSDAIKKLPPPPQQRYTQTEALLSIPAIKKLVKKRYPILKEARGKKFLAKILALEKKYKQSHYVFYHAFSKAWLVPQDLMLELTKALRPLTTTLPNFRFLRWQEFAKQNVTDFLMNEISSEGLINDNSPGHRASLLSVNLALFGNVGFEGESTFDYFLKPKSHAKVDAQIIKGILKIYDAPETYLDDILALNEQYLSPEIAHGEPREQVLLQIFIPKSIVDDVGYVAWVQGIPYERELVAMIDNLARSSLTRPPTFSGGTEPILKKIREQFKKDKENDPLYAKIIKHIKKGRFRLSRLLEKYTNTPAAIPGIQNVQARLLFTDQLLLNPSSNILFYSHDLIPENDKKRYKQKMKNITNKIVSEKLNIPKDEE